MTPQSTAQTVAEWPLDDQLELVFRIWDQIVDSGWQPQPSDELKAELDRRWAAYQADPTRGLTWEEVVARVRRDH
jgi:putative addiction module component (TIGR02574 family)